MLIHKLLIPFARLIGDRSGTVAMVTVLSAPVLLGCVGAGVDTFMMLYLSNRLQVTADAAALAGVKELDLAGSDGGQVEATATAYVKANLASSSIKEEDIKVSVVVDSKNSAVDVTIAQTWAPMFLHFVSDDVMPLKVNSRAQSIGRRLACVIGLSKILPAGVQLWSNASLTADGCDVYSNTELPTGLVVSDNAVLKAEFICTSGGYIAAGPKMVDPQPITDCPAFDDPLASRQPPKIGSCDHLATIILNQTRTLNPGVYCGGLTILGTSKVTLNPGVYIINNGLFTVAGSATLKGENVGFYLAGLATLMLFDSNSTIDLTAPKSGPLAGILFFEDRKAPPLRVHRIGSNNARNLLGTIYLPVGILLIDSNAPVADKSDYTAIVVRSLQLREGPKLVLHSDYENSDVPVPDGLIVGNPVLAH
ncbi:MAG: TadE/TadG family type IV pilus assembly protein [Parvibaculaceae bacterium]